MTSRIDGPLEVVRDVAAQLRQTVLVTSDRAWGVPQEARGDLLPHGTALRGVEVDPQAARAVGVAKPKPIKPGDRRHVGVHPDVALYWSAPEEEPVAEAV
jgi:hypothetical protein